jgi:hypothetical protein
MRRLWLLSLLSVCVPSAVSARQQDEVRAVIVRPTCKVSTPTEPIEFRSLSAIGRRRCFAARVHQMPQLEHLRAAVAAARELV